MRIAELSVRRPVFATVLSMMLVIFGLVSLQRLSVREYPDIDRPVVSITTSYRGASSAVIETKVTQVIEDSVAGIEGILKIESDSEDERSQVRIEFDISRDIDAAANDVRDRIARVAARLPMEADPPQIVKADANADSVVTLGVQLRHDVDARAHRLRRAQSRRSAVDCSRRRERRHHRRATVLDAHLARPPGARGSQPHRQRHRGRAAPRERRAAGGPARVAYARILAAHDGRSRQRGRLPQPRDHARQPTATSCGSARSPTCRLAAENERSYSRLNGKPGPDAAGRRRSRRATRSTSRAACARRSSACSRRCRANTTLEVSIDNALPIEAALREVLVAVGFALVSVLA